MAHEIDEIDCAEKPENSLVYRMHQIT